MRGDDLKVELIGGYLVLVELGVMMMMMMMIRSQRGGSQESEILQHSIFIQKS